MMKVSLKTQVDNTLSVMNRIKSLTGMDVLVGIPEETAGREDEEVNNAQLIAYHTKGVRAPSMREEMGKNIEKGETYNTAHSMYITAHGSPLHSVPPRPIIEPAIEATGNKERIAEDLKVVSQLLMEGKRDQAIQALHMAGMDATNMIKAWFDDPRNGWAPNAPLTIKKKKSDKVLVDTGQMRNAITHVVEVEGT
jgi:hypothetical protein